jgi:cyclopropane fatty-acyl-phospholipid synthase-like methyltransferase
MPKVRTFEDVHVAFARSGAPQKQDVARHMEMRPETFSNHIRYRDARVPDEWADRFNRAWDAAIAESEETA